MGGTNFSLGLTLGAFLLASWVDAKVGDSRPESTIRRIGHAVVAVLVLQASVGALYLVHAAGAPPAGIMAAVFALFLPALVYALLTGLWVMRLLAEIARFAR
jgi:biotin transporter BioY